MKISLFEDAFIFILFLSLLLLEMTSLNLCVSASTSFCSGISRVGALFRTRTTPPILQFFMCPCGSFRIYFLRVCCLFSHLIYCRAKESSRFQTYSEILFSSSLSLFLWSWSTWMFEDKTCTRETWSDVRTCPNCQLTMAKTHCHQNSDTHKWCSILHHSV